MQGTFLMGAEKINSRSMLHSRLVSQVAVDVRRSASEVVKAAEGEKYRSLSIVAQAQRALEKAQKIVAETRSKRERRRTAAKTSADARKQSRK